MDALRRRRPRPCSPGCPASRRTASSPARPTGANGTTAWPASTATRTPPPRTSNTMRDVFREARRVLADDGTCWLNLGDSYSASGGGATGMHAYLGEHITTHRAGRDGREEPARPAVAGRVRAPGRRLDSAERGHLAQAQRDARVGPRPAQLPARAAVPARQVARLLVRPGPDPRTPRRGCAPRAARAAHPAAG